MVITPSGSPTADETYSLECSCSVNGTSDTPSYQWLVGPPDNRTLLNSGGSLNIYSYTTSRSMLQFTTLRATDGGEYTCEVTVGGHVAETTTIVEISRKYHTSSCLTLMYMAMGLAHTILPIPLMHYSCSPSTNSCNGHLSFRYDICWGIT